MSRTELTVLASDLAERAAEAYHRLLSGLVLSASERQEMASALLDARRCLAKVEMAMADVG